MQCKSISALEGFLQHFDSETELTYITSMCCGCSSATIPVAEISHHWNVPHVRYNYCKCICFQGGIKSKIDAD